MTSILDRPERCGNARLLDSVANLAPLTHDELTVALYASDQYVRPFCSLDELRASAAEGVERLGAELDVAARRLGGFTWMQSKGLATPDLVADHESRFPAG
ncbi:hypothetical protein ACWDVB_40185, partial [Streptomyces sp. NPDC003379]